MDYAAGGQLRKLSAEKAWATIEELARYEDEGWNDLVAPGEGSLDYENPDIEQLLGVMECKVDTLMKEAISLMGRSESVFGMTSNTVYQLPSEPSRQEEFKNLVMNFILDQEEKVKQLEEYMGVIGNDFMQLSLEVVGKLKEEIRMEKKSQKDRRIVRKHNPTFFKKLNIGLLEETDHIFGLADGTKSYPVGIVKDVEVHIGKLKLLNDFYIIDMKKDPETPLLVGRGFLATANAVIDYRMAKIATTLGKRESYKPRPRSDGIDAKPPNYARKDFLDCHLLREWEVSRDAELNPFKDTLVFRRMVEFLGAIPINLKGN
ncbi:MAK10-like protein [Tanacetum coccineum]